VQNTLLALHHWLCVDTPRLLLLHSSHLPLVLACTNNKFSWYICLHERSRKWSQLEIHPQTILPQGHRNNWREFFTAVDSMTGMARIPHSI
jgi:hypothetical protein